MFVPTQVHVQHAARDQATREDEETTCVAADALPEGQSDRRFGGCMRGGFQSLEGSHPLDALLRGSFSAGTRKKRCYWRANSYDQVASGKRRMFARLLGRNLSLKTEGIQADIFLPAFLPLTTHLHPDRDISIAISVNRDAVTNEENDWHWANEERDY